MYLIGTIEGIGGNMGSCDILLTRIFVFLSREGFKISGRNYVYTNLYDDGCINLLDDEAYQICNKVI